MNISAITFFDNNDEKLSTNSRIEVDFFKPEPTFYKTINEIKDNNMKIIASAATNLSAITFFDDNFEQLSMNSIIEVEQFEPEPTFENTNNDIKYDHLKVITYIDMNASAITSNKPSLSSKYLKSDLMPWILLQ